MLDAPNEGDWGVSITDDFFAAVNEGGFDSVRLPVRWSNHAAAEAPYTIDAAFMNRVESVVDRLLADGHYVVMDMHHYHQFDGDPLDPQDFSVRSGVLELRFLTMWRQIAERFKDKSDHLLFEIYNEPHDRITYTWNDLAARALNVIRESNPTRIAVIGPVGWNHPYQLPSLRLPNDANLIVTVHSYGPWDFAIQGAPYVPDAPPAGSIACCDTGQQAQIDDPLAAAQAWSTANHYPVFLGEFGTYHAAPAASRYMYARYFRDRAEARGIPWFYWEFASGGGIYDPIAQDWYETPNLLDALVGPR
jgi:endoglucanase